MTLSSRLSTIVNEYAGGNNTRFARDIGIKPATFLTYVSNGRLPNSETLAAIHRTFGVDLNWLCTGEGTPDGPDLSRLPIEQDRLFKIIEAVLVKLDARSADLPPRALAAVVSGVYRIHDGDDYPPESLVDAALDMVFDAREE